LSAHGFHRVVYHEWGDPENPRVVVCVHGLTRTGRDFDSVAGRLAPTHRVLAVDMPGRGESEWLRNPQDYAFPTYLTTLTALIARSGAEQVDWIGTSLGGLLGMVVAADPATPVARLVVNDIGPTIAPAGLERIAAYVGERPTFATFDAFLAHQKSLAAPFGPLDDAQWEHLARTAGRQGSDGRWTFRYDPGIAVPFRNAPAPTDLWPVWDRIRCPTLLLRGADSDVLAAETARAMTDRGPRPRLVEFAGVGHAPALMAADQIDAIVEFLAHRSA
jgi:pimeloyl-ACP methyl ester carboxylesterase